MSRRFDLIAQQLLEKDFAQCTIEELEHYAAVHPFLAPAHFLLLKKLQEAGDPSFKIKAQKAALYYHQPVAFEAFLLAGETFFAAPLPEAPDNSLEEEKTAPAIEETTLTEQTETNTKENTPDKAFLEAPAETPISEMPPDTEAAPPETEGPVIQPEEAASPKMPILPQAQGTTADALLFEPYHTVDYFASQGIKLSQEELPKDKFGKQLMSFTAWLKTMKKLPASEGAKNMDPQAEQRVEHMAAHSVHNPEVVTETMAEVWIKQGQPQKAAEVYRKLSLLHPSKKVYFAAKLENLKQ